MQACNDQVRLLEQRRGEMANPDAARQVATLSNDENNIRAQINASVLQVTSLEKMLAERTRELMALQEEIASNSPPIVQKYNALQADLNLARSEYELAARQGTDSSLAMQAKTKLEAKQAEIAAFSAENQRWLPDNRESKVHEVQTKQGTIALMNLQIAEVRNQQSLLESNLNNNRNQQAALYDSATPAALGRATRVTVGGDGKIALRSAGDFTAAGLTPAELQAAIGPYSTVRIEQSASRVVTVLVPLSERGRFHVSGQVTAGQQLVQSFETESSGQPALAKAMPLRAGRYHLVVVVKNTASGAAHTSALDFTVE